jgi:DCN1-like protein 1/2
MLSWLLGSVTQQKDVDRDVQNLRNSISNRTATDTSSTPSVTTSKSPTETRTEKKAEPLKLEDMPLESLFDIYLQVSREEDVTADDATVSGLIKFSEDLGVTPQDIVMLIILYQLNSTRQYVVTKDQFVSGWKKLGCNNLKDMRAYLPRTRKEFHASKSKLFHNVYLFAFNYNKEPDQKSLANADAIATWQLFYQGKWAHINKWCEFIEKFGKSIPLDTWKQFYHFVEEFGDNLTNYNPDEGSWPVVIDEFVEFMRAQ